MGSPSGYGYHPALEMLNLGLRASEVRENALHQSCDMIKNELSQKVDDLMKVRTELMRATDKDSFTLSERSVTVLKSMSIRETDEAKLSPADTAELKHQIDTKLSDLRHRTEQVFTTEITPRTHEMKMFHEGMLLTLEADRNLKARMIKNQTQGG